MSNLSVFETEPPDWDVLNSAQVELDSDQVRLAVQLSQPIYLAEQRWSVYLTALGMLGFQQWLSERAPDLNVQIDQASIQQVAYANLMAAACNLRVGAFKVCLIAVGSTLEEQVNIPIAALDLPDFAAHFYVLTQVLEEEDQVAIAGFFTYDQFHQSELTAESDWTYAIPIEWVNSDANILLLSLRCLDSNAIRLPALDIRRSSAALREKLTTLNVQNQALWDILTIEEGLTLLSDPILANSLYAPQQNVIDVRLWLGDQIDAIAQTFGWKLMPNVAIMRSLREDFDSIRSTLEQQGVEIPSEARGAYRTLRSTQGSIRLYAITWILSETSEWMLLVALGSEPNEGMPRSLKLTIRDQTDLLFEQILEERDRSILYAQVIGNWEEQFQVTVTANGTDEFEILPFGFDLSGNA